MSRVWDTVVIDRLSRDTMSEREIKHRPKSKGEQQPNTVAREHKESMLAVNDSRPTLPEDDEIGPSDA
jgi:hypothetical protein